ncbi:MAG: hypothetical protein ACKOGM_06515 [Solirubrobacterales bacterium]
MTFFEKRIWSEGSGFGRLATALGVATILAFVFGYLGASKASADEFAGIDCGGKVILNPDGDEEYPYQYEFKCDKDLRGYSIISNRQIDATISEPIGLLPDGAPAVGEDFFCTSGIPSWGLSCYGSKGTAKLSAGNTIRAGISLFNPICDANQQPQFWMVPVYNYTEQNTTVTPPTTSSWIAAMAPVGLGAPDLRCKVLNPRAKAKQACDKAKRLAPGTKAKTMAQAKCRRAQEAVKASR